MITIVDYGMGNLGSVVNMFRKIGVETEVTGDPVRIAKAQKILLPGVGAFDAAVTRLDERGLRPVLDRKALQEKVPVLGICLGMQLLTDSSEEGSLPGLGWIRGQVRRFNRGAGSALKVPHMGWNRIFTTGPHPLTDGLPNEPRFYFVHSYFVETEAPADVLATTPYGTDFHSMICRENIAGAQFHPEKSHKFGMKLLANFAAL